MNILIIGLHPELNTSFSKLNKDLINNLNGTNNVQFISLNHNVISFLPDNDGLFSFDGVKIHPFLGERGELGLFVKNVMKTFQPNVVITVGEKKEHNYMIEIKTLYPNLFKWISIIVSTGNFNNIRELNLADAIVVTNKKSYNELKDKITTNIFYFPYVGNFDRFIDDENKYRKNTLISNTKNSVFDNSLLTIKVANTLQLKTYIHYNNNDSGNFLLEEFENEMIKLPKNQISLDFGISDEDLSELYKNSEIYLESSIRVRFGLSFFESIFCGCIPIAPNYGVFKDFYDQSDSSKYRIDDYDVILSHNNEELVIVHYESILSKIKNLITDMDLNKENFDKIIEKNKKCLLKLKKDNLPENIKYVIGKIVEEPSAIIVDSY